MEKQVTEKKEGITSVVSKLTKCKVLQHIELLEVGQIISATCKAKARTGQF